MADDAVRCTRQRVFGAVFFGESVFVLGSNNEVDNVDDDAQTSGDDQQYTNDVGLTTAVRVHHGCGLIRLHHDVSISTQT